jgi:flavin-dependent dehydrogenase
MGNSDWVETLQLEEEPPPGGGRLSLTDRSRVAVIGGGPAGSIFAYFLLEMAGRVGMELSVDIIEPRNFEKPAPVGCNMCGGIISESLVQNLATEGINLPGKVVQRGIDSYMLHMDVGSVRIATPQQEMRIGAVTRGPGPRDVKEMKWESFDYHLLRRAIEAGARVVQGRVDQVELKDGRPHLRTKGGEAESYDLVAVAMGVNSPGLKLFEGLGLGYERPSSTKTLIREYYLGEEVINRTLGSSMHVFLLDIPRLEFAAIIPKGDYVSMCLLGEDIDNALVENFVSTPEVQACMPPEWQADARSCQCMPRIAVRGVKKPFADRVVFVGDCGVTRLYKDGIGAAYRTAKAAARTAVFEGISEEAFRKHYLPSCQTIANDNLIGKVTFLATRVIQKTRFARRAVLKMTINEQTKDGSRRRMSSVLWDMFSGSAPYKDIFLRTLHPAFLGRLSWSLVSSLVPVGKASTGQKRETEGTVQ